MSRYTIERGSIGYRIVDAHAGTVDVVSLQSAADYDVRKLNAGEARIDIHACIGCRVVPTNHYRSA